MKKLIHKIVAAAALATAALNLAPCATQTAEAALTVSNVSAKQRFPWNGLVDVKFTLTQSAPADVDKDVYVRVTAKDAANSNRELNVTAFAEGTGKGPFRASAGGTTHTVVWNMGYDEPTLKTSQLVVSVQGYIPGAIPNDTYLVINLAGGASATRFPVRTESTPPDLGNDTCRTTELWLRRIPKGEFYMGSETNEPYRINNEVRHQVELTQDYYIGVFEVTGKQWQLVMGDVAEPSAELAVQPKLEVSYLNIRGNANWPAANVVDSNSFMRKLRDKSGVQVDLPTEAQWEYACRAGTTTAFNNGTNEWGDVGNSGYNDEQSVKVGSYLANTWGLYDMHGNAPEWCLDAYTDDLGTAKATDPRGPVQGSTRVVKGGSGYSANYYSRSASRVGVASTAIEATGSHNMGFRIAAPLLPIGAQ
jgi:formylglycine-generating enzyme required for sulfatase activity